MINLQLMLEVTNFKNNASAINNFISWKHSFNDDFTLVAGLHNTNVLLNNKSTVEPRIAINWKLNNIKFSSRRVWQTQHHGKCTQLLYESFATRWKCN